MNQPNPQAVGLAAEPAAAIGKYRWTICGLLFFATTINYLDRQVLSLLAPALSKEFGWSNSDYANIAAVFQFVYAISMLFAGRVIDKMGTRRAFVLAIVVWSMGAILHAYSVSIGTTFSNILAAIGIAAVPVSVAGFMVGRAVLALGEAGNFPAAIKATAEYFPKKERSFATGIFNSGANIGAILAPITVPLIAELWGWQSAFIIIGAIGFVWMGFWLYFYETPARQKRLSRAELDYINSDAGDAPAAPDADAAPRKASWFKLLAYRQTWAFTVGKFLTDGVWWFFLFWLPKFMSAQYGVSATEMVLPLAVLYSMTMFGSIGGGWFPTFFINRGASVYQGRMRAMLTIAFFPLAVLLAQPLGYLGIWVPVVLIGIGASAHQAWSANLFTTVSDMFPKHSVGSVVGIGGMAGGLGGVMITKVAGRMFDHYSALGQIQTGYMIMFTFCALAYLLAWCVMKALVPAHKEITDL
ncbi:MFS transporter [Duganella sp. Root198D2]|uniref:MFS transporter n=1 Tax=Duganella sp. Root198D2 TaxID=1736489 RepID=UPI000709B498|nr:MFS transporter [Duganella sp. Root198D2]KRB83538.1 MFS transporter [Duganella sp. Root198D2]